jgi:enoyl-CoA hydratase
MEPSMSDQIQIQQDGRILRITFNRPDGNGVSDSMAAALSEAVLKAHETSDCVVLRSVGPDFCTGRVRDADFPPSPEAYARRSEYDSIFNSYKALRSCLVPVIGVIEGKCMGFGTAIASLCDVSFASDTATFNIPEIAHNVMPTMVMSAIYDRMNRNAILFMAYSADFISAAQAQNYGIVSNVVPEAQLDAELTLSLIHI